MIIGNPITLGGGSLLPTDAILHVQAPAGSTVTISKGTTTKTDEGHENAADPTVYDYYFIIHASQFDSVNAWTVTATLGTETATGTVTIDTADGYDVILNYRLYIQKAGDGLQQEMGYTRSGNNVTVTFADDYIDISAWGSSGNTAYVGTMTAIDVTEYSKLVVTLDTGINTQGYIGLYPGIYSGTWGTAVASGGFSAATVEIDISNVSGSYYINIGTFVSKRISNIYLEP